MQTATLDAPQQRTWALIREGSFHPQETFPGLYHILHRNGFSAEAEASALQQIQTYHDNQKGVLVYSGFIIACLYDVERIFADPQTAVAQWKQINHAACFCHLFVRFWEDDAATHSQDSRAHIALPMLWRTYWQALWLLQSRIVPAMEADPNTDPPAGWELLLDREYERALVNWQRLCVQEETAWFFSDYLCPWIAPGNVGMDWQQVREAEVDQLVWEHAPNDVLRAPALTSPAARRRAVYLIRSWYLPRYDILRAQHLSRLLAQAEGRRVNPVTRHLVGMERLYGGIGVGYLATALQGDTWQVLFRVCYPAWFAQTAAFSGGWAWLWIILSLQGIVIAGVLHTATSAYLTSGIIRTVGSHARARAVHIWRRGERVSLLIGTVITPILLPILLDRETLQIITGEGIITAVYLMAMVLIYAQIALFFGVFAQLFFDERPLTTPPDAP